MKRMEAYKLEAQEFHSRGEAGYYETLENGRKTWCPKQDLEYKLQELVAHDAFQEIVRTPASYTFLPRPTVDGEEKMPLRVYLSKEDSKLHASMTSEDQKRISTQEFYDSLALTCRTQQRLQHIKNLVVKTTAGVLAAATFVVVGVGMHRAWEKESDDYFQRSSAYGQSVSQQMEQDSRNGAIHEAITEERKQEQSSQQAYVDDVLGISSSPDTETKGNTK